MRGERMAIILEELAETIQTKNIFLEYYKREIEELKQKLKEVEEKECINN